MRESSAEMQGREKSRTTDDIMPDQVPVPRSLVPRLDEIAILLDIDGTLLELMPTPREVWVPPGLARTLNGLVAATSGALALVSGRSLNDIDLIFAPDRFSAIGGHGAEMRLNLEGEPASLAPARGSGGGDDIGLGHDCSP